MIFKKIFGSLLMLAGVALIALSLVIKSRVSEGRIRISSAQEKVDKGNALFSATPYTKDIGKVVTGSAQRKIDEGSEQVAYYTTVADYCMYGGIGLVILGGLVTFCQRSRRKE